jgi:phosphomethylpyrimidine synthase
LAKGIGWDQDVEMAKARTELNWDKMFELVIDPKKAKWYRDQRKPTHEEFCSMCGDMCAIKLPKKYLRGEE